MMSEATRVLSDVTRRDRRMSWASDEGRSGLDEGGNVPGGVLSREPGPYEWVTPAWALSTYAMTRASE
jgi:hypothetical protein